MRKIILSLFLSLTFIFVYSQQGVNPPVGIDEKKQEEKISGATIDFESKVVDYGVVEHNSNREREFIFTNNGTEPLIIKNAKGSCGCTVPTWPREPVMPGSTESIKVNYDTKRVGKFTKTITLTTNVDKRPVILTVKGEVKPAPKEDTLPERKTEGSPLERPERP